MGMAGSAATGMARTAGAASGAYSAGAAGRSGVAAVGAGLANVGKSSGSAAVSPLRRAAQSLKQSYADGRSAASGAAAGAGAQASAAAASGTGSAAAAPPAWAAAMKRRQAITQGATMAAHTLKGGDSHGGGAGPDLSQKD